MLRRVLAAVVVVGTVVPACSALVDLDGLRGGVAADGGASSPPSDAGTDRSAPSGEAGVDAAAGRCTVDQPFDSVARAADLDTGNDDLTAFLGPDELTAWVTRPTGLVLFERASTQVAFAPKRTMLAATPPVTITVTDDGLEALYWTDADPRIRRTTRPTRAADFGPGDVVPALNPMPKSLDPHLTPKNDAVWLAAAAPGAATYHVYRAERGPGGFGDAELIDTSGFEAASPIPDDGELAVYFGSYRPDNVGASDIFVMTRADATKPFGVPRRVTELASDSEEWPRWLSRDRCRLYFIRSTSDAKVDLFVARRAPR